MSDESDLTHVTAEGEAAMVDVGGKPDVDRRAVARGEIHLREETTRAIAADEVEKGEVLSVARVGAVQAVKHTWEAIPLCHQIPVTNVDTDFAVEPGRVVLEVAVETSGKTGCEMEALEGVTTGLNVVWDMVKALEKDADGGYPEARITDVTVVAKEKGDPGESAAGGSHSAESDATGTPVDGGNAGEPNAGKSTDSQ